MSTLYIILAILIFGVLVIVHELGHFLTAKACGVRVEEFSVGMGPAILQKEKGETLYSWRLIPFGGYCAMTGEDEDSDDPRAFNQQSAWKRILILVAGAAMNFLFGFLIVLILFSDAVAFRAPVLTGFAEGCPYEGEQGLQVGDRILSIDGQRIWQFSDVSDFLSEGDGVYDLAVRRNGKRVELKNFRLVPIEYPGESQKMYGFYFGYDEATPLNKLRYAFNTVMEFTRWVRMGLKELVRGQVSMADMSGPVGIVDLMAETGETAASVSDALFDIFYLGAFIAVNLALVNLLPIPGLDGGHVFTVLVTWVIERITGKRLDPKYEGYIHAAGMILLLALMGVIMFNDILKIIRK